MAMTQVIWGFVRGSAEEKIERKEPTMPSMMKIHRQPERPASPSILEKT